MRALHITDFAANVSFLGRTWSDGESVWMNWSAAGFRVRFSGKTLKARFAVRKEQMVAPFPTEPVLLSPVIGVRRNGSTELMQRTKLEEDGQWVTLYDGEAGEHAVEVRKLSENVMGKCGLTELATDGEFLAPPEKKPVQLELVGDSITCGYGNEASGDGFRTEDENALAAYGFLAAEELGMEYSAVCVSGCGAADPVWLPGMENRGMLTMYAFADAPMDRALKSETPAKWDFASNPSKVIVINLGTNDANDIKMQNFAPKAMQKFHDDYAALLKLIRALNGPEAKILCTLGSMDYYLWDEIRDIAAAYQEESGDGEIYCKKLGPINMFTEGTGADTHPSAKTHLRMGKELAAAIREIL